MARREMRHYGWGDPAHVAHGLPDGALELLRARVGLSDAPRAPVAISELRLPAAVTERDRIADNVVQLAQQAGGAAAKAPTDVRGVTVVIDLPSTRADEFRRSLAPLAPPEYSPPPEPSPSADKRTILQVRVGDFPASPTP